MIDETFSSAQAAVLDRYDVEAEERWVDTPSVGGRAHVLVAGEGPPVLMINGIGLPAAMWAPLIARLDGVTVHAVDLPGYGLTDVTPTFASDLRGNAVRFLREVLDGLGLDRSVVVGSSLGSLIASWLTLDAPDRVRGLAHIACPAIVLDTAAPLPMRLLSARPLGRLMMTLQRPSPRQVRGLSRMVREHPLPPEIATLILATERVEHFEQTFLATLHRLLRLRGGHPRLALDADHLASIDVPTLLVFAADDPMGAASVGKRVADAMTNAELHIVDGGHAPWVHHADQIAPLLSAFLERLAARPAPEAARSPARSWQSCGPSVTLW